jgi:hypothetical protein
MKRRVKHTVKKSILKKRNVRNAKTVKNKLRKKRSLKIKVKPIIIKHKSIKRIKKTMCGGTAGTNNNDDSVYCVSKVANGRWKYKEPDTELNSPQQAVKNAESPSFTPQAKEDVEEVNAAKNNAAKNKAAKNKAAVTIQSKFRSRRKDMQNTRDVPPPPPPPPTHVDSSGNLTHHEFNEFMQKRKEEEEEEDKGE